MASVTNIYARAFAEAVLALHLDPARVLQEAQALEALVTESRELRQVWEAPSIPAAQKRAVLDAIVAREGMSPPVRNFLAVLIDHRRIPFLSAIVKQFERELDQRMGFAEAQISSARELSEPERRALEQEVEKLTGRKVRGRYSRDTSLLGGALVKVGSTIYDGSVVGQLERIREQLRNTS
ncbi:MAG TPA: ATP synthase F1 subunit delta [Terriglobales bacterium]|nr:ATP synthase F1 subunit delta [Terriglobales bacterium]